MLLGARQFFERRGGGGWTNPYVTDGLIAMWDGEWNAGGGVHDPNATTWKNLVSDNPQFDLTVTPENVEWGSVYLRLINKAPAAVCQTPIVTADNNSAGTIELVMLTEQINNVDSVFCAGNAYAGNNPIGFCQSATGYSHRYSSAGWDAKIGEIVSYQYVCKTKYLYADPRYQNGVDVSDGTYVSSATVSNKYGYGFGTIDVGRFPGFKRVYSCRIYDRNLTSAELAANYAIDKARFNLP